MLSRIAMSFAGAIVFLYGLLAALSPLPFGAPLVFVGLIMIVSVNPSLKPRMRRLRSRYHWFDVLVRKTAKTGLKRAEDVERDTAPPPDTDETKRENQS